MLDTSRAPLPPACAANIFNETCGADLASVCGGAAQSPNTPAASSDLVNPQSNCSLWRAQYEAAYEGFPLAMAPLIGYLDSAKRAWCGSDLGAQAPECVCLSFPTLQKAQCDAQTAADCPGNPNPAECWGRDFLRFNNGCNGCCTAPGGAPIPCEGQYVQITLGACVPYYCWVGECQNPATQLVTSDIVDGTLANCYVGACVVAQGTDVVDINHQPMLPVNAQSGDFTPGFTVLQACGAPATPAPLVVPTVFSFPVDNAATVPVVISNSGAQSLLLLLGANSPVASPAAGAPFNNWATAPTQILVPARGATKVTIQLQKNVLTQLYTLASQNGAYQNVVTDPNVVTPQGGRIPAPSWVYTYSFGDSVQQFVLSLGGAPISLVLAPPAGAVAPPTTTPQAPTYTWWIAGAAFAVFLIALATSWASDRRVLVLREEGRRILGAAPLAAVAQQPIVKALDIGDLGLKDLDLGI